MGGRLIPAFATEDEDRTMDRSYEPGVCNIGPGGIARRRRVRHLGMAATVGVLLTLLIVDAPKVWRLLSALPAAAGAAGYLQARARFCAYYGLRGLANLGSGFRPSPVTDPEALRRDRRKAVQIALASASIGLPVGLSALLI
jgi:hypothetical protein